MEKCGRNGCGKEFSISDKNSICIYHPGSAVFHDTLKGWSCCKKRVTSFDEFMKIEGCEKTTGHIPNDKNNKTNINENKINNNNEDKNKKNNNNKEDNKKNNKVDLNNVDLKSSFTPTTKKNIEETIFDDPKDVKIKNGSICKRKGCGIEYTGWDRNCEKEKKNEICVFHPGSPLFHDASKGWSCCKKRVLEFDEFLKIPGCQEREKHNFIEFESNSNSNNNNNNNNNNNSNNSTSIQNNTTECKVDFYQSSSTVHVTVFAKNCDKNESNVQFFSEKLNIHLLLKDNKIFKTELNLYSEIIPEKSSFKITPNKVDIDLQKANGITWAGLRKGEKGAGMIRFGVGGRTGTIGGKKIIYNKQS